MGQMNNLIKLPQIYATLYFMIHSIDICDMLTNMMGCNKQVNVTFKFTKNWAKFGPRFWNITSQVMIYVFFSWRYFSMIGHNKYTKAIS